jgi:hypothetical protein
MLGWDVRGPGLERGYYAQGGWPQCQRPEIDDLMTLDDQVVARYLIVSICMHQQNILA